MLPTDFWALALLARRDANVAMLSGDELHLHRHLYCLHPTPHCIPAEGSEEDEGEEPDFDHCLEKEGIAGWVRVWDRRFTGAQVRMQVERVEVWQEEEIWISSRRSER